MKILMTGGAGFIGSHTVDQLIGAGHSVRILDNLEPQVHRGTPSYLQKEAEFIKGDVRDRDTLKKALADIDVVFHLAAMVGVGQSMYQVDRYIDVNTLGTARLLDLLVNTEHSVKKLIVASSMSTYGEGKYTCPDCGAISPKLRPTTQLARAEWEPVCPSCSKPLTPVPTDEGTHQDISSIYALSKKDQEDMVLQIGKTYGIPVTALRYFNVYGPRQSLNNPYTGVAAIFMSRLKNNKPPVIFEDGMQSRDFVSVHDIARANILAMEKKAADHEVFNVGAGSQITVLHVAQILAKLVGKDIRPNVIGKYRKGDVRHCFSDISKIKNKLGYEPQISFEEGLRELITWAKAEAAEDLVDKATQELIDKGLVEE